MKEEAKTWDRVHQWTEELQLLRAIIDKTPLVETIKWGGPIFTINNKNVLGIGGFKHFFTIWFLNGVFLSDPKKVLVNANEGVTKSLRQWRFTSAAEIDEKVILAYINEAIENEKQGKNIPSEAKSKNFIISEIMQLALNERKLTGHFAKFTPYKQYEFVEYIDTAKQEKTKLVRLEKILPMIKDGIGLNDKYR